MKEESSSLLLKTRNVVNVLTAVIHSDQLHFDLGQLTLKERNIVVYLDNKVDTISLYKMKCLVHVVLHDPCSTLNSV